MGPGVTWVLAGVLVAMAGAVGAQTPGPPAGPSPAEAVGDVRVVETEQAIEHLRRARQAIGGGDVEVAAAELRRAATSLTVQASRVGAPTKAALESTATSLGRLANEAEPGTLSSVERIDRAVAGTDLVLATVFATEAVQVWSNDETAMAGRALDAAVNELEAAAVRSGAMLDDATAAALGRGRWFAARLIRDATAVPDDFRQAYEAVATALDSLGRCLATGTAASPLGPAGPRAPRPDAGPALPPAVAAPSC